MLKLTNLTISANQTAKPKEFSTHFRLYSHYPHLLKYNNFAGRNKQCKTTGETGKTN